MYFGLFICVCTSWFGKYEAILGGKIGQKGITSFCIPSWDFYWNNQVPRSPSFCCLILILHKISKTQLHRFNVINQVVHKAMSDLTFT